MDNTVNIKMGDISTLINCQDSYFIDSAKRFYKDFLVESSEGRVDYEIEIVCGNPTSRYAEKKLIFADDGYIALPGFFAGHLGNKKGKIMIESKNLLSSFKYFLKVLYSYLCLRKNALMLHATGIIRNGDGYVFFGPSGSGKTFVADSSGDCTILSDETIIISGNTLFGTPFGTGRYSNINAKICAFFRLAKDDSVYLEDISYGERVSELVSNLIIFKHRAVKTALLLCEELLNNFPCYRMHFLADNSFWKEITENGHIRKIPS